MKHADLAPAKRSTDGKQHEVTVTRQWEFAPGTILIGEQGLLKRKRRRTAVWNRI